jgi:CheY-like chemotaxis protein
MCVSLFSIAWTPLRQHPDLGELDRHRLDPVAGGHERTIPRGGGPLHAPLPEIVFGKARTVGREIPKWSIRSLVFPTAPGQRGCDDRPVTRSVLLVDDDPVFRSLATRILNEAGLEVIGTVGDAAQAVSAALSLKPDAALVDIGLPDRDGVDLAHELAALPWRPRVVLTSTDRDAGARIGSEPAHGGLSFIPKEDLPSAPLRRLLDPA